MVRGAIKITPVVGLLATALVAVAGCLGGSPPSAAAHGVTVPTLFAVARGDRYVPVADMRAVARRVRSPSRRLIVLPAAAGHGWDLLFGTASDWSPLAATVAAFIRRHAGGRRD
jgi:dienelactone hydrolase